MRQRYLNRFIFIGLALVLSACGGTQPKLAPQGPTGDVDTLATEALAVYQLQRDGARTWTLISQAAQQAPQRADLAFLQARLCALIEGCQPEPYEARVRQLDPSNGAIWMRALSQAQRQRDTLVEAQIVEAIGRAERFDVYWNALGAAVGKARMAGGARPDTALNEAVAWLGGTIVPELQPLTIVCSRTRTTEQAWADRCRRLSRVLMNGDTYVVESVGSKLAQQVAGQTAEQIELNGRAKTSRYLWRTYAAIASSQIERDKFAKEILELMSKLRREQDVHLAVARWARRPVTPPADWIDE
jgi:hypothetical protein